MHYSCVGIILFNTDLCKSAYYNKNLIVRIFEGPLSKRGGRGGYMAPYLSE